MFMHFTIVSYRSRQDRFLTEIIRMLDNNPPHAFDMCQDPLELQKCVVNAGFDVMLLDLVGHGSPSRFQMGDGPVLTGSRDVPQELKMLNPVLPKDSIVRLLGCNTGGGSRAWRCSSGSPKLWRAG